MRPIRFRLTLLVLFCGACVGLADDPSPAAKKLAQKLTTEQKTFDAAQKKAKADLVKALKTAEAEAVQNDPGPVGKAKQKSLKAEREGFEKAGTLPASDDTLDGLYAYLTAVNAARPKVRKAHEKLVEQYGKDANTEAEAKAKTDLTAFNASVQGMEGFTAGSRWSGVLQKPRSVTNIQFTVKTVTDDVVQGVVSLDNGWCQMEMVGERNGPQFVLRVKKQIIGNQPNLLLGGFMMGDRLAVEVAGIQNKRGFVPGVAALTRAGGR